ncbi:rhodanese-like domain-containing protein [Natrarchaeobius oligotrophus]|uniref:Rhodanese domain-containing protein n=1 Tax=Natrarchaeobius chitinivorans TaxID=1679083 RepID=A0A3N6MQR3_NATCH|nr:rhodanese-like domain-containing protein [Natrarchaeobius chitinivorans]RQG98591.1 hypothetical protein EA472_17470 [Natrarchaeobius chitinivorans]
MSETDNHRSPQTQPARHENAIQTRYDELVRAAEAAVSVYTPAEAMDLTGETGIVFIDVRDAVELPEGIVSGAIHTSRGRLEAHLVPDNPRYVSDLDDATEIIFYCTSGAQSAFAAQRARELGYDRVGHLDCGISAWKDAGGPMHVIDDRWW